MPGTLLSFLHILLFHRVCTIILSESYVDFPFTDEQAEVQKSNLTEDYIAACKEEGKQHSHLD